MTATVAIAKLKKNCMKELLTTWQRALIHAVGLDGPQGGFAVIFAT